jgi:PASTA domain
MTERFRPLPLLAAIATLLLAALGATIAADETQALKCRPSQCLPPPEEEAPGEEPPPKFEPTRSMLVIGVGWNHPDFRYESQLSGIQSYVDYVNGYIDDTYTKQAAPAPFLKWKATNGGEYMIAPPRGIVTVEEHQQGRCAKSEDTGQLENGGEFTDSLVSQAEAKARQQGFNPDAYAMVMIQFENSAVHCFAGLHMGRRILTTSLLPIEHELGHHEGLGHGNFLRCYAGGQPVSVSGECKTFPYGDPYTAMAKEPRAFGAIHANKLGWLNGQFFDVTAGDFTRSFLLRPFTDPAHAERALRLHDGGTTYWLEYRTAIGVDEEMYCRCSSMDGLVVHREPAPGVSELLDMTPGSFNENEGKTDSADAPLPVGRSWVLPSGEMKVTLNSMGSAGASVTLATRRVTVPNLIGLGVDRAAAIVADAGLWSRGFHPVIDHTCNLIGVVATQQPSPGTRALAGTEVSLGVGEADPNPGARCQ